MGSKITDQRILGILETHLGVERVTVSQGRVWIPVELKTIADMVKEQYGREVADDFMHRLKWGRLSTRNSGRINTVHEEVGASLLKRYPLILQEGSYQSQNQTVQAESICQLTAE